MQLRLGFLSILGMAMLLTPVSAIASDNAQPYKATTVDECIQEKECFWHHLLLAVQTDGTKKMASQNINIKKWEIPIRYRRYGHSQIITNEQSINIINDLLTYVQQNFSVDKKYNSAIVFTDSIEHELSVNFKSMFDNMFGEGKVLSTYRDSAENKKCHYINIQDQDNHYAMYAYFGFVQRDHPDILRCYKEIVYASFGLVDISFSPLIQSSQNEYKYSDLEKLIVLFIYQDFIKSGMSYAQLKTVFDKSYEPFLKYLKENNILQ